MNSMRPVKRLFSYLRYRLSFLVFAAVSAGLALLVPYLGGQDMLYARYTAGLICFFCLLFLFGDATMYFRRLQLLCMLTDQLDTCAQRLPEPGNDVERGYAALLSAVSDDRDAWKRRCRADMHDSLTYYTLWVHQIKTPIAAMRLVLASSRDENAGVIAQELFKIERYADLALRYAKLTDIASDLVIEACALDEIVSECVKKFGVLFVYQKLPVHIEKSNCTVFSDKRWLSFIFEQLLSNAIKYTRRGSVSVYGTERGLAVKDTGIGIRPEDLPRIFEKGYTGFNGRLDNRASGIGLYLAKKAATALRIGIRVTSALGEGTVAELVLPQDAPAFFE